MKFPLPARIVLVPFRILLVIPVAVVVLILVLVGEEEKGERLFHFLLESGNKE